jgi:hypothetical protein
MGDEFDYDTSLRLLQESSDRWGPQTGPQVPSDSRERSLERFAHVLAQLMPEQPSWVETVLHPLEGDDGETEVRALGEKALYTVSNPWAAADADVSPLVRIRPLSRLRGLDVDGFEFEDDGRPVGCTATLLFDGGDTVRLGASHGADRALLRTLIPSLLARLGV